MGGGETRITGRHLWGETHITSDMCSGHTYHGETHITVTPGTATATATRETQGKSKWSTAHDWRENISRSPHETDVRLFILPFPHNVSIYLILNCSLLFLSPLNWISELLKVFLLWMLIFWLVIWSDSDNFLVSWTAQRRIANSFMAAENI